MPGTCPGRGGMLAIGGRAGTRQGNSAQGTESTMVPGTESTRSG